MLDELLLGKTRAAVLRELFANPDRQVSFNELVRRLHSGPGAISRELAMLTSAGLVSEQRQGNQRLLSAGTSSPLYPELKAFLARISGAPTYIREALRGLEDKIHVALIFGSVATGQERVDSDLDLFVIGNAGYSVVSERMYPLEHRLGRRVQTIYFDPDSSADRASLKKKSTHSLLTGPKIFVIGDEARLEAILAAQDPQESTDHGKKNKPRQSHKGPKTHPARR